jgi:anti-sigma factor RsiW
VNCEGFVRSLSDYIDGTLSPRLRTEVEGHLAGCHACHVVLDSTQCTILLYRAARTTALSGDRRRQLLQRLEAACSGCSRSDASDHRDEGSR